MTEIGLCRRALDLANVMLDQPAQSALTCFSLFPAMARQGPEDSTVGSACHMFDKFAAPAICNGSYARISTLLFYAAEV